MKFTVSIFGTYLFYFIYLHSVSLNHYKIALYECKKRIKL